MEFYMKNFFKLLALPSLIVLLTFSFSSDIYAQKSQASRYEYSISGDPIDFLNRDAFNATFEFQTAKINSITIFGTFYHLSSSAVSNAFALGGSYRWYPRIIPDGKRCIEGFAVGPFINGIFHKNGVVFGVGPEFAYKWIFDAFVVEPTFRIYIFAGQERTAFHSWGLGLNLGYAW